MAISYHRCFPSSSFPLLNSLNPNHHSHKHHHYIVCYQSPEPATPPSSTSNSSTPIFLPFLRRQYPSDQNPDSIAEQHQTEDFTDDPILRFFKTRPSIQDPGREGRISLQKNRRSSWHLADDFDSLQKVSEPEIAEEFQEDEKVGFSHVHSPLSPNGISREILQIARNLSGNSSLEEALRSFEGRIRSAECLKVLDELGREGLTKACLQFFEWMRMLEPSLLTPRAYSILFPILGRENMGDNLLALFRNLPPTKEFRDVHVYNAAISSLLCCGRYKDALYLYKVMERDNVQPDHVTSCIVITLLRKNGQNAKDAWEFFQRMNRKRVKWSSEVLSALLKSFCVEGLLEEALLIQEQMEKKGIASNVIVYNTLMDAYAKFNYINEAEGLLLEMKQKAITPTTATYNILINAYSRRMQPEIVEELLREMEKETLKPDVKSFTCLISAYGRRKMSDLAANAFLRMKKSGVNPTSHSYTALIHAYSISGWHEKASSAFETMTYNRIKPSIETYTALLDSFRRSGDTESLNRIWKTMMDEKIQCTRVTFNIVIDGFAKQGWYAEARKAVFEFGKLGFQPDVMTYNMLMNGYARGGQASRMPKLLKEMAALNLKPDSCTYCTMIYAFIRARDFKSAFVYHREMVRSKKTPRDPEEYRRMRAILEKKAAAKNRRDRKAMEGIVNSVMGQGKQKPKKKKAENWKEKKTRRDRYFF